MKNQGLELVGQILKKALEAKKKAHPGISIRSLSGKLDCSPAFLSKVLSGKAHLPLARVNIYAEVFGLDEYAKKSLKQALANQKMEKLDLEKEGKSSAERLGKSLVKFQDVYPSRKQERVLGAWYHLPILDSMTASNFISDPKAIAKRFKLTVFEVESSLRLLDDVGFARCIDGQWEKIDKKINFPTKMSTDIIRNYQAQILKRAIMKMTQKTEPGEFEKRLITSASIAVNSKKIPEARALLMTAINECVDLLTEGECDMVYNLSLQLFSQEE